MPIVGKLIELCILKYRW